MTVSWTVEPKEVKPLESGFARTCRVVFITHLSLSVVIGMLCMVSDYAMARFLWLFVASLLVGVLGYRLASGYGLSGLTGLAVSCGLVLLFATDGWMKTYFWLAQGDNALRGLGAMALLSATLLLVAKAKFFAILKLITLMGPLTLASVSGPQYSSRWLQGDSSVQGSPSIKQPAFNLSLLKPLAEVPKQAVMNNSVKLAQLSDDSQLYSAEKGDFVQSQVGLPNGSWVLVLTELVDRKGNQWFKVMVPFAEGRFSTEKSHFGFIPGSSIEAQVLVPSP